MSNAVWLDNDMAAQHTNRVGTDPIDRSGESRGKEIDMNVDLTTIEGFSAARAAWKAAGCPSDHPYLTAELPKAEIRPLVIEVTEAQWAAVQSAAPIMRAQSDANIRAMLATGR